MALSLPNIFAVISRSGMVIGLLAVGFAISHFPPIVASATGSTYSVSIVDYAFQPLHINITTGTTVTWTYASSGATLHTVTSDQGTNKTQSGAPLIDSGDLGPGQSFSYIFDQPGYYPYQCSVHPGIPAMNGWVNVTGNPVTPPSSSNANGNGFPWLLTAGIGAAVLVVSLIGWTLIRRRRASVSKGL